MAGAAMSPPPAAIVSVDDLVAISSGGHCHVALWLSLSPGRVREQLRHRFTLAQYRHTRLGRAAHRTPAMASRASPSRREHPRGQKAKRRSSAVMEQSMQSADRDVAAARCSDLAVALLMATLSLLASARCDFDMPPAHSQRTVRSGRGVVQKSFRLKTSTCLTMVFAALLAAACGDSDAAVNSSHSTSCSPVCTSIASNCGAALPESEQSRGTFSGSKRCCIAKASSSSAINDCDVGQSDQEASTPVDSGSKDSGAACSSKQFRYEEKGSSTPKCWTPPASCNGSTTTLCPCVLAGQGLCAKVSSCSEGLSNSSLCSW